MAATSRTSRWGLALGAPRWALAIADDPAQPGRAGTDLVVLFAALVVAAHLRALVGAVWLGAVAGAAVGAHALAGVASRAFTADLAFLVIGAALLWAGGGPRRGLGRAFDLACVAVVPVCATEAIATAIVRAADLAPPDWLGMLVALCAYAWSGCVLALAVVQLRRAPRAIRPHRHPAVLPAGPMSRPTIEPHRHPAVLPAGPTSRPTIEPHRYPAVLPAGPTSRPTIEPHRCPPEVASRARRAGRGLAAVLAIGAAVQAVWIARHADLLRPLTDGDLAPALALPRVGPKGALGPRVELASLRGKVVVVEMWATWCKPCLASLPDLAALARRDAARGLEVLAVNVDDAAAARALFDDRGYASMTLLYDDDGAADRWGATSIPHAVVIDRTGVVRGVFRGDPDGAAALAERLVAAP